MRTIWKFIKLLFGTILLFLAVAPIIGSQSEHVRQMENLSYEGQLIKSVVTNKTISQTTRSSVPTTPLYMLGPVGGFVGGFVDGYKLGRATSGKSSSSGRVKNKHYIEYQFTAPNGAIIKGKKKIPSEHYRVLNVGSKLTTLYHPAYPRVHRLVDYSKPFKGLSLGAILSVSLIFGAWGGWLVWRNWPSFGSGSTQRVSTANRIDRLSSSPRGQIPGRQPPRRLPPRGTGRRASFGRA